MARTRPKDMLVSGLVLLASRGKRTPKKDAERIVPAYDANPGAETAAIVLLFLAALSSAGFVAVYAIDAIPYQTQFLGIAIGLALVFFAAALIVTALRLIVTEELVEEYPPEEHVGEVDLIATVTEEAGSRLTRRRFFKLGLVAAGGGLATAAIVPAASFGPILRIKPYRASDIEEKDFYTAFPEGADKEEFGSPVVLVRLPVSQLRLPPALQGYD